MSEAKPLAGKVALITGGTRGIGLAVARSLADDGASVVVSGRDPGRLESAAKELEGLGASALAVAADAAKREDADRLVEAAKERFGRIDVLVTCAGSSPGGLLENLTEDDWFSSLNLKFMGYVRTCRAVVPHMREAGRGSIVLWSATTASSPATGR